MRTGRSGATGSGGAGGAEQRSSGARWKKEGGEEAADERARAVSGGAGERGAGESSEGEGELGRASACCGAALSGLSDARASWALVAGPMGGEGAGRAERGQCVVGRWAAAGGGALSSEWCRWAGIRAEGRGKKLGCLGWFPFYFFSILFLKQTNMFEFKYKFEFKPHSLN